jgi:hypothetical protein
VRHSGDSPPSIWARDTERETVLHIGPDRQNRHHRRRALRMYQIFEIGLLRISAHIIDSSPEVGSQCTELYSEKSIYAIAALPKSF